jgi:hypothetical protein
MRFEIQKNFDVGMRLKRWSKQFQDNIILKTNNDNLMRSQQQLKHDRQSNLKNYLCYLRELGTRTIQLR